MTIEYDHHSPSSLNLFAASPALWVAEKMLGFKRPASATMNRGVAVEHGVAHGLKKIKAPIQECINAAQSHYDKLMALSPDARKAAYRADIPAMVNQSLAELRPYGEPSDMQGKVEIHPEGLKYPILGYIDFRWAHKGVLTDLKTTDKMPSTASIPHARQVALYASDNTDARLTYCTPKKCVTYALENVRDHRQALINIAKTVERFLSQSDDPQYFIDMTVPNLDSFYWSAPATRQMAFKHWRI